MDVINDLTSSLSSDLNSTELAKDLGLGFLAKSTAINGAVNLHQASGNSVHALSLLAHDSHFQ